MRTDLNVDGMTCAACANRIQRRLGKVDGVEAAQVNFATGRATVTHATSVAEAALAAEIEALGYGVIDDGEDTEAEQAREADLRRRLIVGVVCWRYRRWCCRCSWACSSTAGNGSWLCLRRR